jgi:hypothetical protein
MFQLQQHRRQCRCLQNYPTGTASVATTLESCSSYEALCGCSPSKVLQSLEGSTKQLQLQMQAAAAWGGQATGTSLFKQYQQLVSALRRSNNNTNQQRRRKPTATIQTHPKQKAPSVELRW